MKNVIKICAAIIASVAVIVAGYLVYMLVSYSRVEDQTEVALRNIAAGHQPDDGIYGIVDDEVPVGTELTVTSYNIGFGAYSDDFTFFMDGGTESWAFSPEAVHENIAGALGVIKEKNPDIALIQEVDVDGTRSYHIDESILVAAGMGQIASYDYNYGQNYDSSFLMYPIYQPHGANKAGIMTFAKYEMTGAERRSLPIETGFSKFLDLDRCYVKTRTKTADGHELIIYNFHLSAYTTNPETAQNQLRMVIEDMQAEYEHGNYCIAGGDFNCDVLGNSPEVFHTIGMEYNWAQPIPTELFTEEVLLVAPYSPETNIASCRNPDKPYEVGDYVVSVDGFIRTKNIELIETDVIDTGFK